MFRGYYRQSSQRQVRIQEAQTDFIIQKDLITRRTNLTLQEELSRAYLTLQEERPQLEIQLKVDKRYSAHDNQQGDAAQVEGAETGSATPPGPPPQCSI